MNDSRPFRAAESRLFLVLTINMLGASPMPNSRPPPWRIVRKSFAITISHTVSKQVSRSTSRQSAACCRCLWLFGGCCCGSCSGRHCWPVRLKP